MAVDPSDLIDPPYGFGECTEMVARVQAHCECFKNTDCDVIINVRKQGDWVTVDIPSILHEVDPEKEVDYATLKIDPFIQEYMLGDAPRRRVFGCLAQVFDLSTNALRIVPAALVMEKDSSITINPGIVSKTISDGNEETVTDNFFFTSNGNTGSIGTLSVNFSFDVNDDHLFDDNIIFKRPPQ